MKQCYILNRIVLVIKNKDFLPYLEIAHDEKDFFKSVAKIFDLEYNDIKKISQNLSENSKQKNAISNPNCLTQNNQIRPIILDRNKTLTFYSEYKKYSRQKVHGIYNLKDMIQKNCLIN
ncbi:hypothetical protein BpHYR1_049141 [Brachionus plicatilis]|uniref:Uncharacterized protein n=1 Tax=Brachionus plicatilis TaxID=10195 RepID=A0A3M7SK47_BRAPC|nr:hypothetical protein BpHYR1_049141 [Brachionus plicatilis]